MVTSFVTPIAFGQMSGAYSQPQAQQPAQSSTGGQQKTTTATTKTTYPVGVKGYLDSQISSSKDKKFHVALNGKDLALTPVKFHEDQKLGGNKSSTAVDMKSADGKIYEIDFVTTGAQVTSIQIRRINGEGVR